MNTTGKWFPARIAITCSVPLTAEVVEHCVRKTVRNDFWKEIKGLNNYNLDKWQLRMKKPCRSNWSSGDGVKLFSISCGATGRKLRKGLEVKSGIWSYVQSNSKVLNSKMCVIFCVSAVPLYTARSWANRGKNVGMNIHWLYHVSGVTMDVLVDALGFFHLFSELRVNTLLVIRRHHKQFLGPLYFCIPWICSFREASI